MATNLKDLIVASQTSCTFFWILLSFPTHGTSKGQEVMKMLAKVMELIKLNFKINYDLIQLGQIRLDLFGFSNFLFRIYLRNHQWGAFSLIALCLFSMGYTSLIYNPSDS